MSQNVRSWRLFSRRRRGATVVEFAVVAPALFFLLIGFTVLAMGVYRYQQVAYLAREGARYASTHGAQYRVDNRLPAGNPTTWTQEIRDTAILPRCNSLYTSKLTVNASWSAGDNRANASSTGSNFTETINNAVSVTVSYQWVPEAVFVGPYNLTSTATVPMAY